MATKATKKTAKSAPAKKPSPHSNEQQGAHGRLELDTTVKPILAPRVSKVPAQVSDFLTTAQGQTSPHGRLAEGGRARAHTARGLSPSREDHAVRPRAHSGLEQIKQRVG